MADRSVTVVLRANVNDFKARMREAEQAVDRYGRNAEGTSKRADTALGRMAQSAENNREAWDTVGTTLLGVGAAAAAGVGLAVKTFANFDQAMSNVQAATGESATAMESLRAAALQAGEDTAFSATEAAAGIEQLAKAGVSTSDILAGGLAGALDLAAAGQLDVGEAAEYAASAMTQFNLSGEDVTHVADLLAAGAGKAQGDVSDLGQALAQSGLVAAQTGLSIEETTGALAAFASAGLIGSDAGTSFKTMLQRLNAPSGEAAALMGELGINAYDAQGQFVGLAEFAGQLRGSLEEMAPAQRNAALATIFGTDAVRAASVMYDQGSEGVLGWIGKVDDSGYAAEQAATRLDNLKGDLESLSGAFETALIGAGEGGDGPLRAMVQGLESLVNRFNDLPPAAQQGTLALGGVTAAAAASAGGFALALPRYLEFRRSMSDLADIAPRVATGLTNVGKAAGIAGAVLGVSYAADALGRSFSEANAGMEGTTAALLAVEDAAWGLDTLFSNNVDSVDSFKGALDRIYTSDIVEGFFDKLTGSVGLTSRNLREAQADFAAVDASLVNLVSSGRADEAAAQFELFAKWGAEAGYSVEQIEAVLPGYTDKMIGAANEQKRVGESAEGMVEGLAGVPGATGAVGEGVDALSGQLSESQQRIQDWRDEMIGTVEAFVDPLGVYNELLAQKEEAEREAAQTTADTTASSSDSWEDHVGDVDVSLKEYAKNLAEQNERQERWRDNLVKITDRGGVEVARILADMGAEGADLTDKMANATSSDFERMKNELVRDARFGRQGVVNEIAIMERLGRAGARDTAEGIAQELGVGADEVRRIAARYSINLSEGVNPLLTALGRQRVAVSRAQRNAASGRSSAGYAEGGFEDHTAQIAHGQTPFRVWAEPETGGEAYIPLSPAKRPRSLSIWEETGRRLGVQGFATGGFSSASDVPKPPGTGKYRAPISTAGGATMDHAYDETTEWVDANSLFGGIGSAGGAGGRGWQWQMAVLRKVFPGLPLYSGYRPGAITALGNRSMHGMGRAVDVPPRMDVFNWIKSNFGASTKQLFFSPAGAILNGRPWNMDPVTRRGHWDHIHWGYKDGGIFDPGSILNPHVRDNGGPLLPGMTWNGTGRAETVVPNQQGQAPIHASVRVFVGDRELTDMVRVEVDQVSASARDRFQYAGTT